MQPCLLILFAPGARPDAAAVRAALDRTALGQVSHDPAARGGPAASSDWLEILVNGLTFDLLGLAPGQALSFTAPHHRIGIEARALAGCEAIGLAPGPHLAGAANALPVVRTMLRLAAALAGEWEHARACLWLPAQSATRRDLFIAALGGWLGGGPFPAPCLMGVVERPDGGLASDGLVFFIGQEIVLDQALCTDRVAATRLLVRLADHFVETPPTGGGLLTLEDGTRLRVRQTAALLTVAPDRG